MMQFLMQLLDLTRQYPSLSNASFDYRKCCSLPYRHPDAMSAASAQPISRFIVNIENLDAAREPLASQVAGMIDASLPPILYRPQISDRLGGVQDARSSS
jgi:hypothetical protein